VRGSASSEKAPHAADGPFDLLDGAQRERLDRDAEPRERFDGTPVLRPRLRQHQVGMQPEHGLGLRIVEAAHAREALDAGVFVEARDADQAVASVEREDELGERRRQGDDAVDLGRNRRSEVLVVGGNGKEDEQRCEESLHFTGAVKSILLRSSESELLTMARSSSMSAMSQGAFPVRCSATTLAGMVEGSIFCTVLLPDAVVKRKRPCARTSCKMLVPLAKVYARVAVRPVPADGVASHKVLSPEQTTAIRPSEVAASEVGVAPTAVWDRSCPVAGSSRKNVPPMSEEQSAYKSFPTTARSGA